MILSGNDGIASRAEYDVPIRLDVYIHTTTYSIPKFRFVRSTGRYLEECSDDLRL